ncbi:Bis(5'-adenosyl)-triphosphatase [Cucumispora dikerogammari]|nr:Bis(5'-adenosyl)-triphosphatase [Cucumispora dikerogammari]
MPLFADITILDKHVVYESEKTFVFLSHKPFLQYHLLISPKRVVKLFQDMTKAEYADFYEVVMKTSIALGKISNSQTLTIQNGEDAGQTVKHVHMHMIPRRKRDLRENNDIYRKLDDYDREKLTEDELEKQTKYIKSLFE